MKTKNRRGENNPNWKGGKIERLCVVCGKYFFTYSSYVKNSGGNYCSIKCRCFGSRGKKRSEETKEIMRKQKIGKFNPMYGKKFTKEHIYKFLRRRSMSYLEMTTQKVIDKYDLPYKFVGNGAFFIENLNPDFVNINGEKTAVEVYSKTQKDFFRDGGTDKWKQKRVKIFGKYGWSVLFLEQKDMTEQYIFSTLKRGD